MTKKLLPRIIAGRFAAATLCIGGLATAPALNAQNATDPRIGTWDELKTSTHYDSLLRVFENLNNGMIRMHVNAKLLEANRWHVDFRCDGARYRTVTSDGKFVGITYSCQRTGARTVESSFTYEQPDSGAGLRLGKADWTSGKWTEEVSADGKSYQATGITNLTNGEQRKEFREFSRRELAASSSATS
ncbi:MAG: hypothetical protein WDM77_07660 [Steroidobacteraceae bacterium]